MPVNQSPNPSQKPSQAKFLVHAALTAMLVPAAATAAASEPALGPSPAASLPLPPAPHPSSAPEAYSHWDKFVRIPFANGWIKPGQIQASNAEHAPDRMTAALAQTSASISARSSNWSGSVFYDPTKQPFQVEAVMGELVMPVARTPLGGGCDNRHSSHWIGIDGEHAPMLLQAGFSANTKCEDGRVKPAYHAWIEWLPASDLHVDRPRVRPGDLMFVEIWSASPRQGYAYLYNHTLREGSVYTLTPPRAEYALKGVSVEWIVERGTIDGVVSQLTNYSTVAWPFGVAWNYRSSTPTYYYPGATPPSSPILSTVTHFLVTMHDDHGGDISTPHVANDHFLFFENSGSSASVK